MGDVNTFLAGGQITPEGREAGLTDDDLVGGQLTPEGTAKAEAYFAKKEKEAAAAEKKGKKAEA